MPNAIQNAGNVLKQILTSLTGVSTTATTATSNVTGAATQAQNDASTAGEGLMAQLRDTITFPATIIVTKPDTSQEIFNVNVSLFNKEVYFDGNIVPGTIVTINVTTTS